MWCSEKTNSQKSVHQKKTHSSFTQNYNSNEIMNISKVLSLASKYTQPVMTPPIADITRFLAKNQLVSSGQTKFDDLPKHYQAWTETRRDGSTD